MKHLTLPVLLTAALLTPLAAYAGETAPDADTFVVKDERGDVRLLEGDRASAGARSTTDIVKVAHVVDRSAQLLTTTIKVRDLTGAGGQQFAAVIESGEDVTYAVGTRGKRRIDIFGSAEEENSDCSGGRTVTRWSKNEVVLRVPFVCVGPPDTARLRGAAATFAGEALVYDQTPRTPQVAFTTPAG